VRVVGDFAGWRAGSIEMAGEGDGWWRLTATLAAARYRFR
jgi:1,4-alpha-glucan branching enzyme